MEGVEVAVWVANVAGVDVVARARRGVWVATVVVALGLP